MQAVKNEEREWPKDLKKQKEGSDELKPLKAMIAVCSFDGKDGILRCQGCIWAPVYEPLMTALIRNIHDAVVSGHLDRDATLAQVARDYFWPGISNAVKRFCRNCHICGKASI